MNLELDHFFILVDPNGDVADLLVDLGMQESFRRDHPGQGTSNRRFELSNSMLEFLWVRDEEEALKGPGSNLLFVERSVNADASPFGLILHRKDNRQLSMPFKGWSYQPDYFEAPMAFHVGENSNNLLEPLCIYVPFVEPAERIVEPGQFTSLSDIRITTPAHPLTDVISVVNTADRVSVTSGQAHTMEITLDDNRAGLSKDFRPDMPIVIHW